MTGTNEQHPHKGIGRQPDYDVLQEVKFGRHTQLLHIGGVFESDKGYIVGNTLHGKLVLAPTQAKNALDELRAKQTYSPTQAQDVTPEVSPKP